MVDGFTITRSGNTTATWDANVKSYGVVIGSPKQRLDTSEFEGHRQSERRLYRTVV